MSESNAESTPSTPDSASGPGTATLVAPAKPKTATRPKHLPRFKLLLHNDDVNTVDHVVLSILRLTPLKEEEAILRTLEAHQSGVSLLLVTHRERAELYQDQFTSVKLTTSIEPTEE